MRWTRAQPSHFSSKHREPVTCLACRIERQPSEAQMYFGRKRSDDRAIYSISRCQGAWKTGSDLLGH